MPTVLTSPTDIGIVRCSMSTRRRFHKTGLQKLRLLMKPLRALLRALGVNGRLQCVRDCFQHRL